MFENKGLVTLATEVKLKKYSTIVVSDDFFEKVKRMTSEMGLVIITARQKCRHRNAYYFHDNAPMYCPDCNEYV